LSAERTVRQVVEVGILIGMQPDSFAERQQQAKRTREHGWLPAALVAFSSSFPWRTYTGEHRHRGSRK